MCVIVCTLFMSFDVREAKCCVLFLFSVLYFCVFLLCRFLSVFVTKHNQTYKISVQIINLMLLFWIYSLLLLLFVYRVFFPSGVTGQLCFSVHTSLNFYFKSNCLVLFINSVSQFFNAINLQYTSVCYFNISFSFSCCLFKILLVCRRRFLLFVTHIHNEAFYLYLLVVCVYVFGMCIFMYVFVSLVSRTAKYTTFCFNGY